MDVYRTTTNRTLPPYNYITAKRQSSQGTQGEEGDKGDNGPQGLQGEQGDKGEAGIQGEQGEIGDVGHVTAGHVIGMGALSSLISCVAIGTTFLWIRCSHKPHHEAHVPLLHGVNIQ